MTPYQIKSILAIIALFCAAAPFAHSAWHYWWAGRSKLLPDDMRKRRQEAAFEWSGWKIFASSISLILNTVINLIP